jgi:hypothetical protein
MPLASSPNEFYQPFAVGPVLQLAPAVTPQPFPTLDVSGGAAPKWTSDLIQGDGFKTISCGVTLSRSGTLKINRYVDAGGTVLLKTDSQNLTANTAGALTIVDGLPFASFSIEIANTDATGGHTATISAFGLLLNAG